MYVHLVLVDLSPGSGWRILSESEGGGHDTGRELKVSLEGGRMLVEWEEGGLKWCLGVHGLISIGGWVICSNC